jgi:hypothetical protein
MHAHVSKTRGSSLALLVAHGVTTVRDVGGDHEVLLAWRPAQAVTEARDGLHDPVLWRCALTGAL